MRSLGFLAPLAAIALGSCVQQPQPPGAEVAQALAGRVPAGPAQTCVSQFGGDHLYVLDRQTLAYGYGQTMYVNRLAAPCPGVEQMNTLITEPHGSMYCRGDHIRGLEPGGIIPGPVCILQNWVPYRSR